jgi:hypothetical protein
VRGEFHFDLPAGGVLVQDSGGVRTLTRELKGAPADRLGFRGVDSLRVLRGGEMFRNDSVAVGGESTDGLLVFGVGSVAGDLDGTPWGQKAVVDDNVSAATHAGTQGPRGAFLITEDSPDGEHHGDVERFARTEPTAQVRAMELASVTEALLFGTTLAIFHKWGEGIDGDDVKAEPLGQCECDDALAATEVKGAGGGR